MKFRNTKKRKVLTTRKPNKTKQNKKMLIRRNLQENWRNSVKKMFPNYELARISPE